MKKSARPLSILALLCSSMLWSSLLKAAPSGLNYQGRILKSDGTPLENEDVAFRFDITNGDGSCILFRYEKNGVNMKYSGGVFDVPIGVGGARLWPTSGSTSLADVFRDGVSFSCYSSSAPYSSVTPSANEGRQLQVSFWDGHAWFNLDQPIKIRSVPYAIEAGNASKLGNYAATDFLLAGSLAGVNCSTTEVLKYSGGAFSCVPDQVGVAGGGISVFNSLSNSSQALAVQVDGVGTSLTWNSDAGSGTHTLKIPMASTSGVAAGLLSNADHQALTAAVSSVSSLSSQMGNKPDYGSFVSCGTNQVMKFTSPANTFSCVNISIDGSNIKNTSNIDAASVNTNQSYTTEMHIRSGVSNTIKITGPDTPVGSSYSLKLPQNAGASGNLLTTDGLGGLSWSTPTTALGFTPLKPANNLSDVADVSTSRTNLGLKSAATKDVGSNIGEVASGTDPRFNPATTLADANKYVRVNSAGATYELRSPAQVVSDLSLGSAALKDIPSSGDAGGTEVVMGSDSRLTNARVPINNSVTTSKILDGAVTLSKLDSTSVGVWGVLDGNVYRSTGNVGIGTSTPSSKLSVVGDADIYGITIGRGSGALPSNTVIGSWSFTANTTGQANTTMGNSSLWSNTTGDDNSAFGNEALLMNTTGSQNVGIGKSAGSTITTGSGNIAIGYNAQVPSATENNQISIGNLIYGVGGNVGIGTKTPSVALNVRNGAIVVDTVANGVAATNIDFTKGNVQSSTNSTNNAAFKLCGLKDGGAYTLVLTSQPNGSTPTFSVYSDSACSAGITYLDAGGATFTVTSATTLFTFIRVGNTVYATIATGFTH